MLKFSKRFRTLTWFSSGFILISFLLRIAFLLWQLNEVDLSIIKIFRIVLTGLFFDIGVLSFLWTIVTLYTLLIPQKWIGSFADKTITFFGMGLVTLIFTFTFFAEITFWEEFHCRFNFVAVDYLIYTYEVIKNINESYPLVILIPSILALVSLIFLLFSKKNVFKDTFTATIDLKTKATFFGTSLAVCLFYSFFIKNNQAEWSENRYNNEISKAGIYSFFSEFRNNKLDYAAFYETIEEKEAFSLVRNHFNHKNTTFLCTDECIKREIKDTVPELHPNVVFVLMESMSADFMRSFGNNQNLTPNLDSIAKQGLFLANLFATGNRTVRGMEAVTLSIPPTPGQSIVKREHNNNLYTVASVFKAKNYQCNFFYGGDGYFDNMNSFYGGNGFDIYDRGRGSILSDEIKTTRHLITDKEVTFENAWGICDGDIYNKMIQVADKSYQDKKPFFNFVMTTSNHRPYTYPEGKIDIPSGTGREGAVKYSDFAIGEMFRKIKDKPWFKNTVFVFIADHCASSAGKDEIDVKNYHIPAIIYGNNIIQPEKVETLCSQIDIFPTLFGQLHWNYTSNFFGSDIKASDYQSRALIATYLKLGLLKPNHEVLVLSNKKNCHQYQWDEETNNLKPEKVNSKFEQETIAWYETADYLYSNRLLK
ncbi:LTA synthase family protein [Flavobacterium sp. U410]|jgi:phosphoglycerol transferase MdoB-like AlkP superfamily enzyme